MAEYDGMTPGQVLADASVAEFIKSLGLGIAEAQKALDENSVDQIAEFIEPREGLGGKTLLDLGLSPAFYHYQYADIACSLQLSLKVKKDFSLGLNLSGSYSKTSKDSEGSSESETTTESASTTQSKTRQAKLTVTTASAGALKINGKAFSLNGDTPEDRMSNLQDALTDDSGSGIAQVIYEMQQPSELNITTNADSDEVYTTSNTVAFLGGGFDSAVIRIGVNEDTGYILNDSINVDTTKKESLEAYANYVKSEIENAGYRTHLSPPRSPEVSGIVEWRFESFVTGKHRLLNKWENELKNAAKIIKELNQPVTIEGFSDRQTYPSDSDKRNVDLGLLRAKEVRKFFLDNEVPNRLVDKIISGGDSKAAKADDEPDQDNPKFRKVDVRAVKNGYWLFVYAKEGGPNLGGRDKVKPNKFGDTGSNNGFISLYNPVSLNLSGKSVTIDGTTFPFKGAAAGEYAENMPEAYAKNLATDINKHSSARLKASVYGNVVTISKDGDKYQLTLLTTTNRNMVLSGTEGVTVTSQFSRTTTSTLTKQNSGNRTVAFGASLDVRYSRQFEMNVTGNSSIAARLVSIPAPPQFLETIKDYLKKE